MGAAMAFFRAIKKGNRLAMALLESASAFLLCACVGAVLSYYWPVPPHVLAGVSGIVGHFHEKVLTRIEQWMDAGAAVVKKKISGEK